MEALGRTRGSRSRDSGQAGRAPRAVAVNNERASSRALDYNHLLVQIDSFQINHPDCLWPVPWEEVFGSVRPVELDIGAGDGGFLIQAATLFPERNFFGIERLLGRVRKIGRRAKRAGLYNVRVLRLENRYTVKYLIPKKSVSAVHLYHPDPFPKKKQQKRRLVNPDFVHAVADTLTPEGIFYIRTDHAEYFGVIEESIRASGRFKRFDGENPYQELLTDFEREYRGRGVKIHSSMHQIINN